MESNFTIGNFYTLNDDVRSLSKANVIYSKKNDVVKLLSISLPAAIVEGKDGIKFPICISDLKH